MSKKIEDVMIAVGPEAVDEVIAKELKNALVDIAPTPPAPVKATRKLSFEQWAARKATVKAHHTSGMRAFIKSPDKSRTEDEWNALFENY
ncbi:MAG: hypothetical protein JWO15_3691 [Sphingomonadales bacterium]|nr:hypothetical protein [Sphingomonadales bacterium]